MNLMGKTLSWEPFMMILDYAPEFFMFMTEIVSICLKQDT